MYFSIWFIFGATQLLPSSVLSCLGSVQQINHSFGLIRQAQPLVLNIFLKRPLFAIAEISM